MEEKEIREIPTTRGKRTIVIAWMVSLLFLMMATLVYWNHRPVSVSFLDVGQGDACLIQGGRGGAVLLDGGNKGEGQTIAGYLAIRNVRKLDGVILSHFHTDHGKGILELLTETTVPVSVLYLPESLEQSKLERDLLQVAEEREIPVKRLTAGSELTLGKLRYSVLWPEAGTKEDEENNRSLVIKVEYGENSILFPGDLEAEGAKQLLQQGRVEDIDVLKVPHHGGISSVQMKFLEACAPEWSVISVGEDNQYGEPAEEMLLGLKALSQGIWRTDRDGTVIVVMDEIGIRRIEKSIGRRDRVDY